MQIQSQFIIWCLIVLALIESITAPTCYACIKWDGNVSEPDWTYLNKLYNNIPLLSAVCDNAKDSKFNSSTKTVSCISTCTKIKYSRGGLMYHVRGCKENLYRSSPSSTPCDSDLDPSLCDCTTDFCNSTNQFSLSFTLVLMLKFLDFILQN